MLLKPYYFLLLFALAFQKHVFTAEPVTKKSRLEIIFNHTQTSATKEDETLFKSFWDENTLEELKPENDFKKGNVLAIRAFIENKEKKESAGLATFKAFSGGKNLYICYLCVKKTLQGEGIGSKIIKSLFETYSPKEIEVGVDGRIDNFYKKLGFEYSDEKKEFMIKKTHSNL